MGYIYYISHALRRIAWIRATFAKKRLVLTAEALGIVSTVNNTEVRKPFDGSFFAQKTKSNL